MSFLKGVINGVGGLLGLGVGALVGGKKRQVRIPGPATRDDAAREVARADELARRRGAKADRVTGAGGEPAGGLGRLITGS